ncbi:checkpoint 9-1-1 complex, HUS1 component [Moesziomyces antarcticus T-34]|uniref:Checkpoint 9-1-1 complex, HUS1 component n=1 Tax=Pseudozyma antarctica (strain T-34) TaxID=1151754 RepID=M9LT78_PSEA3|nr:checkpoint 9-1-1 complex, HUS1 component [Moesziomyces antarcticus T-34]
MVDSSAAIRRGHPISFLLFTFVAFIVAVIASTLVADYNSNGNAPTKGIENATRFLLFAGWWGFLIGAVYTGLFLASVGGVITSIAGHGVALFLTWIFWLAGAAALTDRTGGSFNCADKGYPFPYCNSTKALMAFAWIGWIILTLMFAVVVFFGARAFSGGRSVKESLA